jgi:hypothetical protein
MSGGYGGAKRMLWFMAKYANGVSEKKRLGIRFQAIVPQQMVLGTGVGDAGANAYAHAMGTETTLSPNSRGGIGAPERATNSSGFMLFIRKLRKSPSRITAPLFWPCTRA